uniref:prephenate dehydratase n=1 Tax=Ammonifex degensii TaxID=42838 RepID=A0A7C2I0P8_9THEO
MASLRVGFLGPLGTFTAQAMARFFSGCDYEGVSYVDIPELFLAVATGEVDRGVVPVENSLEGSVNITLDLLVRDPVVVVTGEVILPVVHHLLARQPGRYTRVLSHPHALAQCREYLERELAGVPREATTSTAEAARLVAQSEEPWSAVGTEEAAALLGRKLFSATRSLEDAYTAAQEGVTTAEENLRLAHAKLAAGAGTPAEVTAAEADLAAAQQNLFDLAVQHAYMKLAAEKPWAYLGVLAASGSGTAAAGK